MVNITTAAAAAKLKALVFGPAGQGKTYLLGTLDDDPRTSPALILDFEGGIQTLVGRDTHIATVRDWQDYNEAYAVLSDPKTPYRSVGVDSISETQVGGLLQVLANSNSKRTDPDLLAQQDWGIILVQMRRFTRHFRDLPMHVVMTALSGEDLDPRVGKIKTPLLQGAFAHEAPGIFDVVAYLGLDEDDEGNVTRTLLLQNYPSFRIKARSPMDVLVPDEIVNPTAGKLLDALGFAAATGRKGTKQ